jgi:UPF0716 protein FxsA
MGAFGLLLLALYALLEWFAAFWLAGLIGWGAVLVVLAALMVVGIAVMRRAGMSAARSLRAGAPPGQPAGVGGASMLFLAGALIAVPGLLTSLVGLVLLLVPPLRRLVGAGIVSWVLVRLRRRGLSAVTTYDAHGNRVTRVVPGDVVPGEVVPDNRPPPTDPPRLEG